LSVLFGARDGVLLRRLRQLRKPVHLTR